MTDEELDILLGDAPAAAASMSVQQLAPLIVRVHRLTHAQALRICKWAQRLPRIEVLADVTLPAGEVAVQILETQLRLRGLESRVCVIRFTSDQMASTYPSLSDTVIESHRHKHLWMMPALSHAWAFTAEAITICGLGMRPPPQPPYPMPHTWIFEQDCDYAGHIDELIRAYAEDDADLIAKELVPKATIAAKWMW